MKNMLLFAFVVLFACTSTPEVKTPSVDEAVTKAVLDRHFKTFLQNDIDGQMADYAEEAIPVTPNGTYNGLAGNPG